MELSYETIRKIHRNEKKSSSSLFKIEDGFFDELGEYLESELEKIKEKAMDIDSFSEEMRKFQNIKKMLEEISSIRLKKILRKAIVALGDEEYEVFELEEKENEIFLKLVSVLREYRALWLSAGKEKKPKREESTVKVKFLSSIPAFVGQDLKEYGPFKEGDVANLPRSLASILLAKGLAKEVE